MAMDAEDFVTMIDLGAMDAIRAIDAEGEWDCLPPEHFAKVAAAFLMQRLEANGRTREPAPVYIN